MRWITGITLNNYRAFRGPYSTISIPVKNHVLVYGENGSGKSSLYNAIKDFFYSSAYPAKSFEVNYFETIAGNNTGSIEIGISEIDAHGNVTVSPAFVFAEPDAQSTHRVQAIRVANKVKGFLDYKRMLQTHFLKAEPGENPNLFELVIEDLLADHLMNSIQGGVVTVELQTQWLRIRDDILELDGRYNAHEQAIVDLPLFEQALRQLLINVFTEFRRFISTYFDPKLDINITLSNMDWDRPNWNIVRELFLEIRYANQLIPSYQTFLNEARLSAMAVSIYLAALKTYPPAASDLKILYLDDVFIGLDTNNRIPLLKILKNEFINTGFQIFISTYDRQWFETARTWFDAEKCKCKCLELFVNDDDGNQVTPDVPLVIDPSNNAFDYAKKYFLARDYAASANYLRKTCEAELKRILPRNMSLKINSNTDEVEFHKLETLIDNFFRFLTKNNLNSAPFTHFKTYKKIIFNPFSHDDLETPHYKKEIQDCIDLVNELQKIKVKEIVFAKANATKPMKLGMRDVVTGEMHLYELKVLENLQIIQQDVAVIQLSNVECEVKESATRMFTTLQLAFDQVWIERGNAGATNNGAFHNHIKISTRKHLIDLMTF